MKYKDILDTFGGDTSYADRAQAALLKGDTAAFSNVAKEYRTSQQGQGTQQTPTSEIPQQPQQPAPSTVNTQGNNVGDWNYGADTADRQDEIVSNLNAAYEQNPNQFSDWNTFAQNFNYDYAGRSDKERETMRNWYNNKVGGVQGQQGQMAQPQTDGNNVGNTDYFFNQLLNGNPLQGEGAAITAAQNRYNNLKYLSSMTPDQLSSAIESGNLNPVGQDMQDLKNYAPALYAQVQAQMQQKTQLDDINTLGDGIYNGLTKTETNGNYTNYDMSPTEYAKNASIIKQYNESLYKKIEGLGGDTAAYVAIVASMLQNPVIQSSKNEVEDLEGEIRKIQEHIYTIGDTSRSILGSEAPEDLVSAYISHQTKQLQNQLRTAQNSLLVAQGKLNNQLTEVETMIDAINNGVKLYGEGTGGSGDYQFISGSKYQKAGYFNKKTGEFIPLDGSGTGGGNGGGNGGGGGYVDKHNYTDDSTERLKEIANNLESLYKSNPSLFNNRSTFNDYFKYNQRSAKQKQVLDSYWAKYGNEFSIGGTSGGGTSVSTGTESDGNLNKLKSAILDGSFTGSWTQSNMKQYGYAKGANNATELKKLGQQVTYKELIQMKKNLSAKDYGYLEDARWDKHEQEFIDKLSSMGTGKTKEERQRMANYIKQYDLDKTWKKYYLQQAGVKDSDIEKILAL